MNKLLSTIFRAIAFYSSKFSQVHDSSIAFWFGEPIYWVNGAPPHLFLAEWNSPGNSGSEQQ
jgi:hypothetical protein